MLLEEALTHRPLLVVAAHPDDETIGAGGLLARALDVSLIHITDGAPRHPDDARRAGFETPDDYAQARRNELVNALAIAGIPAGRASGLHIVDQEASLDMAYVSMRLTDLFRKTRPGAILTHPYEGGHPDHDAAAFAVHAACARIPAPPEIFEFTSYHGYGKRPAGKSRMEVGRFLPGGDHGEVFALSAEQRETKRRMAECFATQAHMMRNFPLLEERFRPAPSYDFTQAPHPGKLWYENFDWGIDGERWRLLASDALRALEVEPTL